jgi:hypothetical protein
MIAAAGATSLALGACGDRYGDEAAYNDQGNAAYDATAEGTAGQEGDVYAGTATTLPEGSRVVVEEGVRYRVDPGGARIRITDEVPIIYVEDGVRYRVDPGGTRVRVGPDGVELEVRDEPRGARVRTDEPGLEVELDGR